MDKRLSHRELSANDNFTHLYIRMRRTSLTDVLSFVSGTTTFSLEHSSCGTYPIPAIPHEPRPPKPTENPPKNATSISGRFHFTSQRCSSVSFHFTIYTATRDFAKIFAERPKRSRHLSCGDFATLDPHLPGRTGGHPLALLPPWPIVFRYKLLKMLRRP